MTCLDWPDETSEAFANPKVGDLYSEMLSYWIYVIGVEGDCITTIESSAPCTFPTDGKVLWQSPDQFRKRCSYGTIPGYFVRLHSRNNDVAGWLEETRDRCQEYIDK
jgi:hypothetical protein